jgi:hypothetical protein
MKTKLALAVSSLFVLYGCGGGESTTPLSQASTPSTAAANEISTRANPVFSRAGLQKSYVSQTHFDLDSTAYSHVVFYGTIIDDIDRDGEIDIVSFPSNGWGGAPMQPIVWRNQGGKFVSSPWLIKNSEKNEFVRELVSADFNNDGMTDHMVIDIGHEHETGSPSLGGVPFMLEGSANGLVHRAADQWLSAPNGGRAFNHISAHMDFDNDGDVDVAIATINHRGHKFRIYENLGNFQFKHRPDLVPESADAASGTGFVKTKNGPILVAGFYRTWSRDNPSPAPRVYSYTGGKFVESYSLAKPNLGGREINYGASDMFNLDVNGDGLEDLLITWETNSFDGIDDGSSFMGRSHMIPRYKDISNSVMTVWLQDQNGKLIPDPNGVVYNLSKASAGGPLKFADFNGDGVLDFYQLAYDVLPRDFDSMVWINDGRGRFSNPQGQFKIDPADDTDKNLIPFFFDANRDGKIDVVAIQPIFEQPPTKTIGQAVRVFLSH